MPSNDRQATRRTVLRTSSIGIAGLFATGVASAKPGGGKGRGRRGPREHANAPDWARLKNGDLTLSISRSEYNSTSLPDIDDNASRLRRIPYDAIRSGLEEFNEAVKDGDIILEQQNGRSIAIPNFDVLPGSGGDE